MTPITPNDDDREFLRRLGQQIRRARHLNQWSQEELAAKAGMARNFMSQVECGHVAIGIMSLRRLGTALSVPTGVLITRAECAAPTLINGRSAPHCPCCPCCPGTPSHQSQH